MTYPCSCALACLTPEELAKHVADTGHRAAPSPRTLRDEFAMAALTGIMADPGTTGDAADLARCAYSLADAMMTARGDGK